jgi:hypothetical protein
MHKREFPVAPNKANNARPTIGTAYDTERSARLAEHSRADEFIEVLRRNGFEHRDRQSGF